MFLFLLGIIVGMMLTIITLLLAKWCADRDRQSLVLWAVRNWWNVEAERDVARKYSAVWKRIAKRYRRELLLEHGSGVVVQYRYRPGE